MEPLLDFNHSADPGYDVTVTWSAGNGSGGNVSASGHGRDHGLAKAEVAVQCVILFLALVGNSVVLIILLGIRSKRKLSRMNLMIVHLSFADLFVAFFNILPQLLWDITHRFVGGDFLCRSVKLFQLVAMFASSYVLVTTAIDRFLAICFPLTTHYWTKTKMTFLVGVAWALSIIFSIPQVFIFSMTEVEPNSSVYDCWASFEPAWTMSWYITYITVAIYVIPFFCLAVAYGCICYVVWNSMRFKEASANLVKDRRTSSKVENGFLLKPHTNSSAGAGGRNGISSCRSPRAHVRRGGMSQAKVKTVKLTLTVIICYLLCWGPFFVSQMWAAWDDNAPYQATAMVIIMLLPSLNSCTNPWIYLCFSDNLQRYLVRCVRTNTRQSRASTTLDYDTRVRSTTHTEFTRIESTSFR